ncbi:MAG: FecR family protein [Acidobacteriota bacterium]
MEHQPDRMKFRKLSGLVGFLFLISSTGPSWSEESYEAEEGASYARIRAVEGDLQVANPREEEIFSASENTPLAEGDQLTSGADARAEIQFQGGTLLWIGRDTRLEMQSLGSLESQPAGIAVLRLSQGTLYLDLRQVEATGPRFQIDTPPASVRLDSEGEFRIEILPSGEVQVSAFSGEAEVVGEVGSVFLSGGLQTVVGISGDPLEPSPFNTARTDALTDWVAERRSIYLEAYREEDLAPPLEALPEEIYPYIPELNHYGDWHHVPVYGWIWRPLHLTVSWRPYAIGSWRYYPGGWTWISSESWGWYPYHYGRWQWVAGFGWGWVPGGVYSGAWVSWAYSSSYIGWSPLNYYNQPAFVGLHISLYDHRGWNFVRYSRFRHRHLHRFGVHSAVVLEQERVFRGSRNPRFRPRDLADPGLGRRLAREERLANRGERRGVPRIYQRSFRENDPRERRSRKVVSRPARSRGGRPERDAVSRTERTTRIRPDHSGNRGSAGRRVTVPRTRRNTGRGKTDLPRILDRRGKAGTPPAATKGPSAASRGAGKARVRPGGKSGERSRSQWRPRTTAPGKKNPGKEGRSRGSNGSKERGKSKSKSKSGKN